MEKYQPPFLLVSSFLSNVVLSRRLEISSAVRTQDQWARYVNGRGEVNELRIHLSVALQSSDEKREFESLNVKKNISLGAFATASISNPTFLLEPDFCITASLRALGRCLVRARARRAPLLKRADPFLCSSIIDRVAAVRIENRPLSTNGPAPGSLLRIQRHAAYLHEK